MSDILFSRKSITVRTYNNGIIKDIVLNKGTIQEINNKMEDFLDKLTETAWTAYCSKINNKSVCGEALPTWRELKQDNNKIQIIEAWKSAISAVIEDYEKSVG